MPASEVVIVISSVTAGLVTIIGAVFAGLAAIRAGRIHAEVRTMNEKKLGEQIDAATSARFVEIPVADRTVEQVRHLLDVPPDAAATVRNQEVVGNPSPPPPPRVETPLPPPRRA